MCQNQLGRESVVVAVVEMMLAIDWWYGVDLVGDGKEKMQTLGMGRGIIIAAANPKGEEGKWRPIKVTTAVHLFGTNARAE